MTDEQDMLDNKDEYIKTLEAEVNNLQEYIIEQKLKGWTEQSNDDRVKTAEAYAEEINNRLKRVQDFLAGTED